ncbi:hypothetical protein [Ruminococcus flavefaciens]|uniref:hypothetical protein n=1 Tax=Ruminococcus flavefaciens TaxID=1265 RepID=UPI0026EF2761|nr:hypothetical protein [Ruminococcus flavefaciens]
MKKILALMAAAALTAAAVSCGKKAGTASQPTKPETTEAATTTSADSAETTTVSTTTANVTTTTAVTTQTITAQPDPLGGGAFEYNADGAVVFSEDSSKADDKTLLAAAQALYESACRTEMQFTVGCPFDVDYNDYVENSLSWRFYRITDSSIKSFSDVENAYHKVFSDRYPHQLDSLYMESSGSVYALCGNRGSDIYYSSSKVTEIKSKTDDEIFFTVEDYYDGSDFGEEAYTEKRDFSAVIDADGVWKAGQFTLPY